MSASTTNTAPFAKTKAACFLGYITQAVIVNFAPLLFITFTQEFGFSFADISVLISLNFIVQLAVDALSIKLAGLIGYRRLAVLSHIFSAAGLVGLAVFPSLFPSAYAGLVAAVILYAIGGGLIEVLISPIIEACPFKNKEGAMVILHSFYCWGQMLTVLLSTAFFALFGIGNWRVLSCIWAVIPFFNAFFFLFVPINPLPGENTSGFKKLITSGSMWLFLLLMFCSGASELAMSQWASAFAESALHISKTAGDLAGPCLFALTMGIARVLCAKISDKISLTAARVVCSALCIVSYLLASLGGLPVLGLVGCALCGFSIGIMWPSTISSASASIIGSSAMFAMLALAGDLGCSAGPALVGFVAERFGSELKTGLLAAIIFPVLMLLGNLILLKKETPRKGTKREQVL